MNESFSQAPVLVVEDEPRISEVMIAYLERAGFTTALIGRGDLVLPRLAELKPAAIVLDLMLPGMDGVEICRELRRLSSVPIIMVTARVEEIDRLLGFEVGADDYLCKPFSPRELVARVTALLKRAGIANALNPPAIFEMDEMAQRIRCRGQILPLTPQEFRLFSVLLKAPGRIFSRASLLEQAYHESGDVFDRAVDSHIKNLRKKISVSLPEYDVIHSVYGVGYRFEMT